MTLNNKSSKFVLFLAVAVMLSVFTACTTTEETTTVETGNTNKSAATMPNSETTSQTTDMNATDNSANPSDKTETEVTKVPMSEADKNLPVNDKKDAPPAAKPTPIVSSGADDMFLFTQIRGKLSTDKEFENGVMVDIKKGSITLTGEVSSAAQKRKAEDLVLEVNGVKTVRNNLKVSQ